MSKALSEGFSGNTTNNPKVQCNAIIMQSRNLVEPVVGQSTSQNAEIFKEARG